MQWPRCASYYWLLVVCRTLQDGSKWNVRQGPEEPMPRQATAGEPGRSQATEEAGEGTVVGEWIGLLVAQEDGLVPDGVVNGSRWAGWQAQRTAVGEAPGAMATGRWQHFAEVGAESRYLAAIVRCQLQHLV